MRKLLLSVSCASVLTLYAQQSSSIKEIPVFPNATYLEDASISIKEGAFFQVRNEFEGMSVVGFEVRAYSVKASQDEVISYYKKKLNAVNMREGIRLPRYADIKPNSSTKVFLEYGDLLTAFFWDKKDARGDIFHFLVTISDSIGFRGAVGQTILGLNFKHYSKEEKIVVPTEEELGAPRYPNSIYVPEESKKSGFMGTFIFHSDDDVSVVVEFFERELKQKALRGEERGGDRPYGFMNFSAKHPSNAVSVERIQVKGRTKVRIWYLSLTD
jgi:hypothetical protein